MIALNYLTTLLCNVPQTANIMANSRVKISDWDLTMGSALVIGLAVAGLLAAIDKRNNRRTSYTKCDLGRFQSSVAKYAQLHDDGTHTIVADFAKQVNLVDPVFVMNLVANFTRNLNNDEISVMRDAVANIKTTQYLKNYLEYLLARQEFYNNDRNAAKYRSADYPQVMHKMNAFVLQKMGVDNHVTMDDFTEFVNGLNTREELNSVREYINSTRANLSRKAQNIIESTLHNKNFEMLLRTGILQKISQTDTQQKQR